MTTQAPNPYLKAVLIRLDNGVGYYKSSHDMREPLAIHDGTWQQVIPSAQSTPAPQEKP